MPKVKKAPDLIQYASQRTLGGEKSRILRPRVLVYAGLILVLLTALLVVGSGRHGADVTVLRGIGAPFVLQEDGVRNQVRVKIENRLRETAEYDVQILHDEGGALVPLSEIGSKVVIPENPLSVPGKGRRTTSLFLVTPREKFSGGRLSIVVRVTEPDGALKDVPYHLLGPLGDQ
jgi:polyferredoxin